MKKFIAVFAILAGSVLFAAPAATADPTDTPTDTTPTETIPPTEETPAEETPAEETPAEEAPAETPAQTPLEEADAPSGLTEASIAKVKADAFSKKVFVCKYVGTPNVDEVLQQGGNPISVSINSIDPKFEGNPLLLVGLSFADAQGRSQVIAVDNGQPEPSIEACSAVLPTYVQAEAPEVIDPTCDKDGKLVVPEDTEGVTYESTPEGTGPGDYTVTATAAEGLELTDDGIFEITVEEQLSGDECGEIDDAGLLPDTGGSSPWLFLGAASMIAGGVVLLRKKQSLPVVPGYRLHI